MQRRSGFLSSSAYVSAHRGMLWHDCIAYIYTDESYSSNGYAGRCISGYRKARSALDTAVQSTVRDLSRTEAAIGHSQHRKTATPCKIF